MAEALFQEAFRTYVSQKRHSSLDTKVLRFMNNGPIPKKGAAAAMRNTSEYATRFQRLLDKECRNFLDIREKTHDVWMREYLRGNTLTFAAADKLVKLEKRQRENKETAAILGCDAPEELLARTLTERKQDILARADACCRLFFESVTPDDVRDSCSDFPDSERMLHPSYDADDASEDEEEDEDVDEDIEEEDVGYLVTLYADLWEDYHARWDASHPGVDSEDLVLLLLLEYLPALQRAMAAGCRYDDENLVDWIRDMIERSGITDDIEALYEARYGEGARADIILNNPHFKDYRKQRAEEEKLRLAREQELLTVIPQHMPDMYPAARRMKRHFVLHIGPTNSGKTHDAVEALRTAGSGIYLGPLRLLAYEQYEMLNSAGIPCALLTGEEQIEKEGARIRASTIEMADFAQHFDVAVIDEAQMISDPSRGGAWTAAVLGLLADRIEICAAEEAEALLLRLIAECGDTCEVIRHARKTALVVDAPYTFPKDVQKGDALIVFSRRDVHGVAAELRDKGISCSLIYGSLPYEVRHRQAARFASGETDVVVSTDAIGMGMNLPIRRIVFLKQEKYDGTMMRPLLPEETKQIAGRAGRYGMYDTGYVTACGQNKLLRSNLVKQTPPLDKAIVSFPPALLGVPETLSGLLTRWQALPETEGYKKADVRREIRLAREIERKGYDDRSFAWQFVTIPFAEDDKALHDIWAGMVRAEAEGEVFPVMTFLPSAPAADLGDLEEQYRICDLLYVYCTRFDHPEYEGSITATKKELSERIFRHLQASRLEPRKCRYCGKRLPWNYPYGMCQQCHDARYSGYRGGSWWDDDDDFW